MTLGRARTLGRGCLALLLIASESQARSDCDAPRSVALDIVDGTTTAAPTTAAPTTAAPTAAVSTAAVPTAAAPGASSAEQLQQIEQLERSVIAELGASQISVCAAPSQAPARVQIRATLPDWQRASIRFEAEHSPALERSLDVSKLPPEARALAIASATDELIRSAFAEPAVASAEPAPPLVEPIPAEVRGVEADRREPDALGPTPTEPAPLVELGLAAAGSSYFGQREALEADLAARYWLLPRLPLSARLGIAQRRTRPPERGDVQPDDDVHAALGAGFALWREPGVFDLIGEGGVLLSRVGFDERMRLEEAAATALGGIDPNALSDDFLDVIDGGTRVQDADEPLDHGWALAASLGVEGRVRTGPLGFSLALAGLVPIVPARSDWGNQTSLDTFGVQLRAAVWVLLGKVHSP